MPMRSRPGLIEESFDPFPGNAVALLSFRNEHRRCLRIRLEYQCEFRRHTGVGLCRLAAVHCSIVFAQAGPASGVYTIDDVLKQKGTMDGGHHLLFNNCDKWDTYCMTGLDDHGEHLWIRSAVRRAHIVVASIWVIAGADLAARSYPTAAPVVEAIKKVVPPGRLHFCARVPPGGMIRQNVLRIVVEGATRASLEFRNVCWPHFLSVSDGTCICPSICSRE